MKAQKTIIFLHIPKAAGTTLSRVFLANYRRDETFTIDGVRGEESTKQFIDMSADEKRKIRLLQGHMVFGLHKHLVSPFSYITILRNPIDRVVSHYYYVLREPKHYLYNEVVSRRMNLQDYVGSGISTELNNDQVRLIAGIDDQIPFGCCTRTNLEQAIGNLRKYFEVVGISERFDESLLLLKKKLGWHGMPLYRKTNVTKGRPRIDQITRKGLKTIEKMNELDMELYEYAGQCFEMMVKELLDGNKVRVFSIINRMYQNDALWYRMSMRVLRKAHLVKFC
jgi:hypothetical protein